MEQEMKILEYKTIDTGKNLYNNMFMSKDKRTVRGEKETEIAILEHIKLRKKNKN